MSSFRGSLQIIQTSFGQLRQERLRIYQEEGSSQDEIDGNFRLLSYNTYGFVVANYQKRCDLVIDPSLVYSTYLGGINDDWSVGIAVDSQGCAYITGWTSSADFPNSNAYQMAFAGGDNDAFVTKFSAQGNTLIYSTYLGGNNYDSGSSIAVDAQGCAYITGDTQSSDFPTRNAYQNQNANVGGGNSFVTKLSPEGNTLIYSTYLGGDANCMAMGIAADSEYCAYVVGKTDYCTDFPIKNAYQTVNSGGSHDAFITKFSAQGNALVYSTYLGGNESDIAEGITVDAQGCAYIVGLTQSSNFPTKNAYQGTYGGNQDAFITKFSTQGNTLVYSSYLGGNDGEGGLGIAVDSQGCTYVAGYTTSNNFPTQNAYQVVNAGDMDAFITKFSSQGNTLAYSTYFGGSGFSDERASGIAVDSSGCAYVVGNTGSLNFPTQNAYQVAFAGGYNDAFITKLSAQGNTLVYSTYLGGSDLDWGNDIALDSFGRAFITGYTTSTNFPTQNAYQVVNAGGMDAFISKLGIQPQVTTNDASNISLTSARLNGTLSALGTSNNATVCFQWGTTSGIYPNETPVRVKSTVGAFSNNITSLNPATTYYFRAKVVGDGIGYGEEKSFTTLGIPIVAPQMLTTVAPSLPSSSPQLPERLMTSPARLSVKYLNVQPQQAQANQPITVYANIANGGDEGSSYTATLKINGMVEETRTGKVGGHAAVPLQFVVSRDKTGTYNVDINGQKASFIIVDTSSADNISGAIPLIGFILCAVGVIVVSVLLFLRRRGAY